MVRVGGPRLSRDAAGQAGQVLLSERASRMLREEGGGVRRLASAV